MASVMRAMSASMGVGKGSSHTHSLSSDYGGGEELQRTSSLLLPPNPALVVGSPTGILINAHRPYSNTSAASSSSSIARNTSFDSLQHVVSAPARVISIPPLRTDTQDTVRAPLPPSPQPERGRSTSRESTRGPKIRFAPLPVRPRSYSTGRDVWLEDEDITLENGQRHWVRRNSNQDPEDDEDDDAGSDSDLDSPSKTAGVFGSWSSSLSNQSKKGDDGYASKILRPFGMGKKKSKGHARTASRDRDSLSKTESIDSDISRGSSDHSGPRTGSTGIPMRKTSSWGIGDGDKQKKGRVQYPSVAQRSRHRSRGSEVSVSAPAFVEWGNMGQGSNSRPLKSGANDVDDDDGSGMAWVKRRRAEREAAEKKEREEAEAKAALTEDASSEPRPIPPLIVTEAPSSGTTTPRNNQSGLSATRPDLHVDTGSPSGASTPPLISSKRLGSASDSDVSAPATPTTISSVLPEPGKGRGQQLDVSRLTVKSIQLSPGSEGEEDSDDDDDDEDGRQDDSDSDLDEDEIAEEEALAEKARMTAKSAGAERYHNAMHQTRLLKVEGSATTKKA